MKITHNSIMLTAQDVRSGIKNAGSSTDLTDNECQHVLHNVVANIALGTAFYTTAIELGYVDYEGDKSCDVYKF